MSQVLREAARQSRSPMAGAEIRNLRAGRLGGAASARKVRRNGERRLEERIRVDLMTREERQRRLAETLVSTPAAAPVPACCGSMTPARRSAPGPASGRTSTGCSAPASWISTSPVAASAPRVSSYPASAIDGRAGPWKETTPRSRSCARRRPVVAPGSAGDRDLPSGQTPVGPRPRRTPLVAARLRAPPSRTREHRYG